MIDPCLSLRKSGNLQCFYSACTYWLPSMCTASLKVLGISESVVLLVWTDSMLSMKRPDCSHYSSESSMHTESNTFPEILDLLNIHRSSVQRICSQSGYFLKGWVCNTWSIELIHPHIHLGNPRESVMEAWLLSLFNFLSLRTSQLASSHGCILWKQILKLCLTNPNWLFNVCILLWPILRASDTNLLTELSSTTKHPKVHAFLVLFLVHFVSTTILAFFLEFTGLIYWMPV